VVLRLGFESEGEAEFKIWLERNEKEEDDSGVPDRSFVAEKFALFDGKGQKVMVEEEKTFVGVGVRRGYREDVGRRGFYVPDVVEGVVDSSKRNISNFPSWLVRRWLSSDVESKLGFCVGNVYTFGYRGKFSGVRKHNLFSSSFYYKDNDGEAEVKGIYQLKRWRDEETMEQRRVRQKLKHIFSEADKPVFVKLVRFGDLATNRWSWAKTSGPRVYV
jgi:hypothetical protein